MNFQTSTFPLTKLSPSVQTCFGHKKEIAANLTWHDAGEPMDFELTQRQKQIRLAAEVKGVIIRL
jgi:hypothetical protein